MYGAGGSLYLGKVPTKNITTSARNILRSTKPVKVVMELSWPYTKLTKADEAKRDIEIAAALKKAGVNLNKPWFPNK